jgi:hypothetical protein
MMSLKRHNPKRDKNEREIVAALRLLGCKVMLLDQVDLLVLHNEQLYLMEVKTAEGRMTKSQEALVKDGWPLYIVRTVDDALVALGISLWEGRP